MKRVFVTTMLGMLCGYVGFDQRLKASGDSDMFVVPTAACADMAVLNVPNTEISSATPIAASGPLPAHCRTVGVTHGEPGSNVTVEVRMPDTWNGKVLMTTRQGYMGLLVPITNPAISVALSRHYATITTDGGHVGATILDASFGLDNPPGEVDFGYRGSHLSRVFAQAVTEAYYSTGPTHAYFNGCSSSGRYALQSAEHYPGDFDGIIAGAPAIDLAGITIELNSVFQSMAGVPLPTSKLPEIFKAVMAACDGLDGVVDGLIDDPRTCHFDVNTLLCAAGDAPDCLTAPQVATLEKIYGGVINSAGQRLYPGYAFGGELPDPVGRNGWDTYITGDAPVGLTLQDQYLKYLAFDVDDPTFDWRTFNVDLDPQGMTTMRGIIDPVKDDITGFADAGGKMIIYQGWADIQASPYRTLEYYNGLRRHQGRRAVENYARLFMVPGMYHCVGGIGPNAFDALTALEQWVEQGRAPSSIIATKTVGPGTNRSRPLCPYPQHAMYKGTGSIDDAANFACVGAPIGTGK